MGKFETKRSIAAAGVAVLAFALVLFCLPVSSRADESGQAVFVEQGQSAGAGASGSSSKNSQSEGASGVNDDEQGSFEASGSGTDASGNGNSGSSADMNSNSGSQQNQVGQSNQGSSSQPSTPDSSKAATDQGSDSVSGELATTEESSAADSAATQAQPKITYAAHVQNIGWQSAVTYDLASPNATIFAGTSGKALRMEALKLSVSWDGHQGGIEARSHVQNLGWISWASGSTGTTGRGLRMEALQLRLTGELAQSYSIWYRVHCSDVGWLDWACNGAPSGTTGKSHAIEAVQIVLVARDNDKAPGSTARPFIGDNMNISGSNSSSPAVYYQAHCALIGWQNAVSNGAQAGTTGRALSLEALRVQITGVGSSSIQVSAHIANVGWQGYVEEPAYAGTVGRSTAIQAVKLNLTGEASSNYDIYYRVHAANLGWLGWAKNNQEAGTVGFGNALEAIEIRLVKHGDTAPAQSLPAVCNATVSGTSHVQDYGWRGSGSGTTITLGTTGKAKRLEAFTLKLGGSIAGSISYSAHVSDIGWQSAVSNGATAGTVGKAKQVECVKINLTGDASKYYDVWYRAHVQDYGWMGWTLNGAMAGTTGIGYRIEALQVTVRLKGTGAPGSTARPYTNVAPIPADQADMIRRASGYSSSTPWLILVDTHTNRTGVFYGSRGKWGLSKYWAASTGKPSTPTVLGEFTVGNRGYCFGTEYTCYYWTQFYQDYLFHSVEYVHNTFRILDGRLGQNISHGCVRLDINNAKWIYDNIPRGTKVVCY